MSRVGKKKIIIPINVKVKIHAKSIQIEGYRGQLSYIISNLIQVKKLKNIIELTKRIHTKKAQELHGLSRTIIDNMIIGVSKGFQQKLIIQGIGYKAQIKNNHLILNVGYSHPIYVKPKEDITIHVNNNTVITITGINKEVVGQIAAIIRAIRPPEPYKEKGIKYENEIIKRKVGKIGK
uniref:Ribosomal protein L6 n=1 Tax=Harveyella mirabilis TaxID=282355 RepID=A0A3S8UVZ7_9FLOR|nr:ribosomal protein L6 [Harveyella mirabilis]